MSTPPYASQPYGPPQHIVITDIHIPFWRLVGIFVKWALAAIPATIILVIIFAIVGGVFGLVMQQMGWMPRTPMGGIIP
jgi:hypothetical protein